MAEVRSERDSLGEVKVPLRAYWGAETQRALLNFPISGLRPDPALVRATVLVKLAAARANAALGLLEARPARALEQAATEILSGALADQFVVDPFQAGAGTSHHMNVNEVLANRANEILGAPLGAYDPVHPHDHVNLGQSTNDVFPTAMRLAVLMKHGAVDAALKDLAARLGEKADAFARVVTAGRTHLQDATPITLGQVFRGFQGSVEGARSGLAQDAEALLGIGLGGTAVGTGVNRHPEYPERAARELSRASGFALRASGALLTLHTSQLQVVRYAGGLKAAAVELGRVAGDLRLMASGPTSGIGEIVLPAVQPGSSIMPGKVNPVLAEALNMVCFHVTGAETAVAAAGAAGQFQLNVMMPVIAYEILFSQGILSAALGVFTERCVAGITANPERARAYAERTVALATVLSPVVGYEKAAAIVKRSLAEGRSLLDVAAETLGLSPERAAELLSPLRWTEPGAMGREDIDPR
jgi:aspartate ammonia-lyase